MSKEQYIEKPLQKHNRKLLDTIKEIIEKYRKDGRQMTVRQVYYQLVSNGTIENIVKEYVRVSRVIVNGRMLGEIDWDAIVDNSRKPDMPTEFEDLSEFMEAVCNSYRTNRWKGQSNYVEVFVEKDALAGILRPITNQYHVLLLAGRGYLSTSAMYQAAERFKLEEDWGKTGHILYLGDHDPSGKDMERDLKNRLEKFGAILHIKRLALTKDQVEQYNLLPVPVKESDTRSKKYMEFTSGSWELDALDPDILVELVESNIRELLGMPQYEKMLRYEMRGRNKLRKLANTL